MFRSNLLTYYELKAFESSSKGLLLHTGLELFLKNNGMNHFYDMRGCNTFSVTDEGLWVSYEAESEEAVYSKFIDFYGKKISLKDIPISFGNVSQITADYIIGTQWEYLFLFDRSKKEERRLPGSYNPGKGLFQQRFVVREYSTGMIKCFDISFNLIWSHKIFKVHPG